MLKSENVGAILSVSEADEREDIEYCLILRDFTKVTIDHLVSGVAFIARNIESGESVGSLGCRLGTLAS